MREDNQNSLKYNSESGSIIIWIFIAVILFAALGFAFNSSNRSSTSFLTDAQAEAYASEIMATFNEYRQAIKRILLQGCDPTTITYSGASGPTYNTGHATDGCWVFRTSGAGLTYKTPPEGALDPSRSADSYFGEMVFVFNLSIEGVGGRANQAVIPYVSDEVCKKINEKLFGFAEIPVAGGSCNWAQYNGTINSGCYDGCTSANISVCGTKKMGCYEAENNNGFLTGRSNIAFVEIMNDNP